MSVAQIAVAALEGAPNIEALLEEYRAEGAIDGLPRPLAQWDAYRKLEAGGLLHVFAATSDDALVGFLLLLVAPHPHYFELVASSESFFVSKAHRMGGLGLKLLKAAEAKAVELGAPGMLISAPLAGKLAEVLPRLGYAETNRTFFKKLESTALALEMPRIPAMSAAAIDLVRQMEVIASAQPQVAISTVHILHGGLYARTIKVPSGVNITGVLLKRATLLIVEGDCLAYIGDDQPLHLKGYNVVPASAGRKQAFYAVGDTNLTMILPSKARTVAEVESDFTDEADILLSHRGLNRVLVTGE